MGWSRRSSLHCHAFAVSSSSPGTPALPTRADPSTLSRSAASWGFVTSSKGVSERQEAGCGLPGNLSKPYGGTSVGGPLRRGT
jgi:hypothetical protein